MAKNAMNRTQIKKYSDIESRSIRNMFRKSVRNQDDFADILRTITVDGTNFKLEGMIAFAVEPLAEFLDDANGEDVTITLNSDGGFAFHGMEMYQMLKDYEGTVNTVGSIAVASAAVMPFVAGEERTLRTGAQLMVHPTSILVNGNKTELDNYIGILRAFDESLVAIYAEADSRLGDVAQEFIVDGSADKVFTAKEALDVGFATKLENADDEEEEEDEPEEEETEEDAPEEEEEEPTNRVTSFDWARAACGSKSE